ncbi:hypothetical protein GCM10011309_23650 [Litorimonas cladophorae]|uniref:Uncharacterized protein n=1 Tax=Litorimonas cladophorae TaxID=1220491 RepID=A0A918KR03_9PROT|nr:hypothetical protein [Litorimonas cladophorae]GGX72565.1 hypothetical protein GCM10011309_23650 [Litorimonas cladophorae]
MRKSHRQKIKTGLGLLTLFIPLTSAAQIVGTVQENGLQQIIVPSSSSSFNQNGFNLPSQAFVSGQDVIKSTSGITCQSAIGHGGPKLDMGVIGSNDLFDRDSVSIYGRVSVPIGKRPKRVDCTQLYDLEISRLKMELQLLRAGMQPGLMAMTKQSLPYAQDLDAEPLEEPDWTPLQIPASPAPKAVTRTIDADQLD